MSEQGPSRRSTPARSPRRISRSVARPPAEAKIIARGLRHPGPIHMLRTQLAAGEPPALARVIVDSESAADGIARYCAARQVPAEIDLVGDEFHVLIRVGSNAQRLLAGSPDDPTA